MFVWEWTMQNQALYHAAAQEDRCGVRVSLGVEAKLRPSGSHGFVVTVYDLSISGFCCTAVTGMRPGALCWLTLPGLSGLQAQVVWNDGARVGCAFETLLNQAVLDRLVALHGSKVV